MLDRDSVRGLGTLENLVEVLHLETKIVRAVAPEQIKPIRVELEVDERHVRRVHGLHGDSVLVAGECACVHKAEHGLDNLLEDTALDHTALEHLERWFYVHGKTTFAALFAISNDLCVGSGQWWVKPTWLRVPNVCVSPALRRSFPRWRWRARAGARQP